MAADTQTSSNKEDTQTSFDSLSPRMKEILDLAVSGRIDAEIAERTGLKPSSLRAYWSMIRKALKVETNDAARRRWLLKSQLEAGPSLFPLFPLHPSPFGKLFSSLEIKPSLVEGKPYAHVTNQSISPETGEVIVDVKFEPGSIVSGPDENGVVTIEPPRPRRPAPYLGQIVYYYEPAEPLRETVKNPRKLKIVQARAAIITEVREPGNPESELALLILNRQYIKHHYWVKFGQAQGGCWGWPPKGSDPNTTAD